MPTPELTEATTNGIRIGARSYFLPEQSNPDGRQFVFGYTILISNEGPVAAQLVSRHWIIIDVHGRREEVRGPGVVGQTPRLERGQAFKYQSFCPLPTTWGTMEGTYEMRRDDGSTFQATVPRFYLRVPKE